MWYILLFPMLYLTYTLAPSAMYIDTFKTSTGTQGCPNSPKFVGRSTPVDPQESRFPTWCARGLLLFFSIYDVDPLVSLDIHKEIPVLKIAVALFRMPRHMEVRNALVQWPFELLVG